jgi:hypothetical protein
MPIFTDKKSIYYNDVNLLARPTAIDPNNTLGALSRKNIPVELNRVYVSPMQAIVGIEMAQKATELGLGVCLHRFPNNNGDRNWGSPEGQIEIFKSLADTSNVFVSVGLNDFDRVKLLAKAGVTNWLIDMANGYMHKAIAEAVRKIKEIAPIDNLMVGNVHTNLGVFNLARELNYLKCPIYIRVGIAGGSPCATNDSTGYNRGQITELMECANFQDYCYDSECDLKASDPIFREICDADVRIVADGGIKNSGYASKAFGAGADAIIMGGYFARASEAETNLYGDGTYWGGASEKQQILATGSAKRHSEGKEFKIEDPILSLEKLVSDLWGGISSAVSYSGYKSLSDFIYNGYFEVKENSLPPRRN